MKNKIKVMNKRPEITDEELERFKDFDALLTKHHQSTVGNNGLMKWGGIAIVFLVVSASTVYYFISRNTPSPNSVQPLPITQEVELAQNNSEPVKSEESVKEEPKEITPVLPKSTSKQNPENKSVNEENRPEPIKEEAKAVPVYVQAEPVNGYAHLYEYFNRELIYPPTAVKDSIQGVVTISFIIDRKGNAGNLQFIHSLGKSFEEETTRLIQNMPPWKSATLDGDPVPSKMTLPLTFQIKAVEKK